MPSFQRIYTYNVVSYAYVMSAVLGHRVQSVITHRAGAEGAKNLGIVRLREVVVTTIDNVAVHELLYIESPDVTCTTTSACTCKLILSHL